MEDCCCLQTPSPSILRPYRRSVVVRVVDNFGQEVVRLVMPASCPCYCAALCSCGFLPVRYCSSLDLYNTCSLYYEYISANISLSHWAIHTMLPVQSAVIQAPPGHNIATIVQSCCCSETRFQIRDGNRSPFFWILGPSLILDCNFEFHV